MAVGFSGFLACEIHRETTKLSDSGLLDHSGFIPTALWGIYRVSLCEALSVVSFLAALN